MSSGCVRWWYASRTRIASQQPAGRFVSVDRAFDDCDVRQPFSCGVIAQGADLCGSDVGRIHATGRPHEPAEPHGPRPESRADVSHRHAGLELEQPRELGDLGLCRLDLRVGQARLLPGRRPRQREDKADDDHDMSHDWCLLTREYSRTWRRPLILSVVRRQPRTLQRALYR